MGAKRTLALFLTAAVLFGGTFVATKAGLAYLPPLFFVAVRFDIGAVVLASYAAVSMSFHGCILSMIGGCPAVPVTHGDYYNHKYIGFSDYNPAQAIPLFHVSEAPDATLVDESVEYFAQYDPRAVAEERRRHNEKIESYYRGILDKHNLLSQTAREAVHA